MDPLVNDYPALRVEIPNEGFSGSWCIQPFTSSHFILVCRAQRDLLFLKPNYSSFCDLVVTSSKLNFLALVFSHSSESPWNVKWQIYLSSTHPSGRTRSSRIPFCHLYPKPLFAYYTREMESTVCSTLCRSRYYQFTGPTQSLITPDLLYRTPSPTFPI